MQMSEFINLTSGPRGELVGSIRTCREKIERLSTDIESWNDLEKYLLGDAANAVGQREFDLWVRDMDEEPTVDAVRLWRGQLENERLLHRHTVESLSVALLLIAQNGIKLTVGAPNAWRSKQGRALSSRGECLFKAIWHGRNLAAHVEGLKPGGDSAAYFADVKVRRGLDLNSQTCEFPCTLILKELLGWIDPLSSGSGPLPYSCSWASVISKDFEAIANVA